MAADADATKPDLARLKRMFEDARSLTQDDRQEALRDEQYYNCKQWTPEELAILKSRKQPDVTINRVRTAINSLLGIMEQGKSDPRAYLRNPPMPGQAGPLNGPAPQQGGATPPPRPPQAPMGLPMPGQQVIGGNGGPPLTPPAPTPPPQEDAGDVATKVLRYIADHSRFHQTKMAAFKDGLIAGRQAAIVECATYDADVLINHIRWEEFFYDPRSRRPDFKDARYLGVAKWMYADHLKMMYADLEETASGVEAALSGAGLGPDWTWQDRPGTVQPWIDSKQRRLMVVDLYHQEADGWFRSTFFAGQVLESGSSPYSDEHGQPVCPIEAQSVYVDDENRRHGLIRDMRGPQDEINMRRSKALHILNSRQIQEAQPGAGVGDADEARAEAARPDGVIPPGWSLVNTSSQMAGQLELLQEAKTEIERMSPAPGVLARQGADASGRAVLARQAAGMTEHAPILGAQQDWELRIHQQAWARARQFWRSPKWIRITDDFGAAQFIQVNQQTGADPMTGQPILQNGIATTDVDIIIDSVKDTATLQQEQFSELMQLFQAMPQALAGLPPLTLLIMAVKLSSIVNKQEIINDLEQAQATANAAQAQKAQQADALAQQEAEAKLRKMISEAVRNVASAKADDARAELDRRDALLPPDPPPAPPAATGDYGAQGPAFQP